MDFDYDKVAPFYDAHRKGGGPYLSTLVDLARTGGARHVLELGSGTAQNTVAFHAACPVPIVGLERSRGMLAQATKKGIEACFVRGSATELPFADASFDFVFACFVLHHITGLGNLFRECARVLSSGYAAFVTSPHDFIRNHPMNRYFPSFAAVDLSRFQSVEAIHEAMGEAGFGDRDVRRVVAEPRPIDRAYVDRIANQFISTYALLPPEEFQRGVERLYRDIAATGHLSEPLIWEAVVVWGRRR